MRSTRSNSNLDCITTLTKSGTHESATEYAYLLKVAGYRAGVVNLLTSQVYCVSAHRVDAMKLVALCRGLVGLLFTTKSGGLPSTSKATRGFKLHETSSQKSNCANVIARRKSAHIPLLGFPSDELEASVIIVSLC